ncbi:hypothetical protein RchiOBHm_Chr1g0373381 [Rosa chinensis]|uniref:Uncharacterized protein n=1 Tax=Rosa chinensis TaxID=74649 RepID=A0A2P6SM28_ROSCH|nr:hypothetical protein RchiOBHm_Chr1g0373381 [Rosa chinensis]
MDKSLITFRMCSITELSEFKIEFDIACKNIWSQFRREETIRPLFPFLSVFL